MKKGPMIAFLFLLQLTLAILMVLSGELTPAAILFSFACLDVVLGISIDNKNK